MNATTVFLDDRLAAGDGDRPALVTARGNTTYRGLVDAACRAANALRALGVEAEQRVALLLPDCEELAAVFFGTLRIGAVAVPLNTRLPPDAWIAALRDSRARVLVTDAALAAAIGERVADAPRLRAVLVRGGAGSESLAGALAAAAGGCAPEDVSPDDAAVWLYTSGTTGGPKAAIHPHRNLLACRHYGVDVLGVSAADRVFATSKLFFAYALGNALLLPCFAGAATYLHEPWPEPAAAAEIVARFRPTLVFSVPTFYARLLRAGLAPDTFQSVRACVSAGERLSAGLYAEWRARFGVEILDGLGATETIFMVLSHRPGQSRAASVGTPVPGTAARLLDGEGREVAEGTPGVLHVRTPSASTGYWSRVDASRRAFVGEWFRTGDVMTRDADGFYYHAGREDDFFKVAGMWVAPADVEEVLLGHPDVADAGVIGAEDGSGLVKPFAFVVPRNGRAPDALVADLAALAAARLPAYQRPRRIVVLDGLPRTATGKLQRFALHDRVARA